MDCRSLLPHELPHGTRLIQDFVEDFSRLSSFYAHSPSLEAATEYARQLTFPTDRRREIASILRDQNTAFGSGKETEENLQRLEAGAVAVISGQQVGLFGGPAYSFYKALSAIETARELRHAGVDAVPIFWMATEDHDVDEVRHATWFHEGKLLTLVLDAPKEEGRPAGRVVLGDAVESLIAEIEKVTGGGDAVELLRGTYSTRETYGSAFAKLFAKLFAPHGLILLDPLDARIHKLAGPLLRDALARRDELNAALLERDKELEKAGYAAQVKVTAKSTLLFSMEDGQRQVISASDGTFSYGGKKKPREEVIERVAAAPELFSPNALLRPVMQDYILPTAIYYGGPAEIAYFAQSQVLYQRLLGRMPVLLTRADYTLVDPKATRILQKYGLRLEDVWEGAQALRKKMYAGQLPAKVSRKIDDSLKDMGKAVERLKETLAKTDPTLLGAIAGSERKMRYQVEKLRTKTGAALDRHEKKVEKHAEFLENLLYPKKGLQSRDLSFLPFLQRLGPGGMEELQKLACVKKPGRHYVVGIG